MKNTNLPANNEISFTNELIRKSIHLAALSIPTGYIFVERETALWILIPLALVFIIVDILSKWVDVVHRIVYHYFGKMLRTHEKTLFFTLTGASWVMISASLCVLIFPKLYMITGFCILIISDIAAAIFGRKYGRTKFLDKSFEGTLAFWITAILVVVILGISLRQPISFMILGSIAGIVGGIAEGYSISLKLDDNLSIPMSIGISLWLLSFLADYMSMPFRPL